jgi:hypothetical protein
MSKIKLSPSIFLTFAVMVSAFGMISLPMFLLKANSSEIYAPFTRILIGSIYTAVCVLGITAVFYPNKCQKSFMFRAEPRREQTKDLSEPFDGIPFKAHHPNCEKYFPNRIQIRKTTLCASCAGLLAGALAALTGTVLYFFAGTISLPADYRILWISNFMMLIGLFQFKLGGYLKLIVNAFFVFSSFITLTMVDLLGKNLLIDAYALCLIVFLLLTRISFSEWNNKKICAQCNACGLSS